MMIKFHILYENLMDNALKFTFHTAFKKIAKKQAKIMGFTVFGSVAVLQNGFK
jgi:hypothetical protein